MFCAFVPWPRNSSTSDDPCCQDCGRSITSRFGVDSWGVDSWATCESCTDTHARMELAAGWNEAA